MKNEVKGGLYAMAAMLLWGLSFGWSKIVLESYSPVVTIFVRLSISAVFLFGYLLLSGKMVKIPWKDLLRFAVLSFFLPFVYFIGENYGIYMTSSTTAALIIATIPLFIAAIAWIWFDEPFSFLNILGFVISFTGVGFIVYENGFDIHGSFAGTLFLFLAVGSAVIYTVFIKDMSHKYDAIFIIAIQNLFGMIYFLPLLALEQNFVTTGGIKMVFYFLALAILCSSLAYIFYVLAVKYIGMAKTEAFANLIPVIAALYAFFVLGEVFGLFKMLGMIFVLVGLFLAQLHGLKRKS